MSKMENILQFFSIWQKLKVTVSPLFTAPRDFKFSETFFFTQCHITVNFATLRSEKVAYHPTLIYKYTVHCPPYRKSVNGHFWSTVGCGCLFTSWIWWKFSIVFHFEWDFFSQNWLKSHFRPHVFLFFIHIWGVGGWFRPKCHFFNPSLSNLFPWHTLF